MHQSGVLEEEGSINCTIAPFWEGFQGLHIVSKYCYLQDAFLCYFCVENDDEQRQALLRAWGPQIDKVKGLGSLMGEKIRNAHGHYTRVA
jgi:hypothetical protein